MKKLLLSCITIAAGAAMAMAQVQPIFPEKIDLTATGDETPTFPKSIKVTLYNDGLEVEEMSFYGYYTLSVSGEIEEKEYSITLDVPEGWDGFVSIPDSEDIIIGESGIKAENTRANSYGAWISMDEMLAEGGVKGDKFTFRANGGIYRAGVYLYKGDKVFASSPILLISYEVTQKGNKWPTEFPEDFTVQLSSEGPTVTVEQDYYMNIRVKGECTEEEITVTVDVPEDWEGFLSYNSYEDNDETRALTRGDAHEIIWKNVSDMLEDGYKKKNTFTFPTDGVSHYVELYLYKDDKYDYGNLIDLRVNVKKATTGITSAEAAGNVRYYNLQGAEVAYPESGTYIKVSNGNASKVIVK